MFFFDVEYPTHSVILNSLVRCKNAVVRSFSHLSWSKIVCYMCFLRESQPCFKIEVCTERRRLRWSIISQTCLPTKQVFFSDGSVLARVICHCSPPPHLRGWVMDSGLMCGAVTFWVPCSAGLVWMFVIMNVFIALKGTHFWILYAFTAAGVVPCGGRKTSPRTSTIVQFIFYFWSFEISVNILRNQK